MIRRCNCCGQVIGVVTPSGICEDYLSVSKEWGYFSSKDLTEHRFNICEACYDKWISTFKIPVEEFESHDLFKGIG